MGAVTNQRLVLVTSDQSEASIGKQTLHCHPPEDQIMLDGERLNKSQ